MPARPKLILFSGLGVDARLLAEQRTIDADIIVPAWIEPTAGESLASYGRRFAAHLRPTEPIFIGGVSFGGMVAQEVARHVPTRGLVLLATCRSWRGVPAPYRWVAQGGTHLPLWAVEPGKRLAMRLKPLMGLATGQHLAWFDAMLADTDAAFLQWAGGALANWPGVGPLAVPYVQIQGARDLILPARYSSPTHVIPRAGHLVNITHAPAVNAIVGEFLAAHASPLVPSPGTPGEG
jgi:pimeloyl-ACP methyl ester carboxylesterase